MRQGQVTGAERGKFSQDGEIAVNHVAAFDADERGDFALPARGTDFVRGDGECEIGGMAADLFVNGGDLFEGAVDRLRALDLAG